MSHWCAVVVRGTLTVKAKLSKVVSVEMSDVYQVGFNAVITVNERERDFYESNRGCSRLKWPQHLPLMSSEEDYFSNLIHSIVTFPY